MKNVLFFSFFILLIVAISQQGCYYDNEEDLYPAACDTCDNCDLTNVSYTNDIIPIMSSSCYSCHSGSAPTGGSSFDTYETFQEVTNRESAQFMCRIKWESGCSAMPPTGTQLSECSIDKIQQWIDDGSLNN